MISFCKKKRAHYWARRSRWGNRQHLSLLFSLLVEMLNMKIAK